MAEANNTETKEGKNGSGEKDSVSETDKKYWKPRQDVVFLIRKGI